MLFILKHQAIYIYYDIIILEVVSLKNLLKDNKELMIQWDYDKNKNLDLNKITVGNKSKAWWICPNGHSYEQVIYSKSKGMGCPVCSNKLVLKGYNDIATTNPELLDEWDYDKNLINNITPYDITKGAEKKIWWICSVCGESYECFAYSKKKNTGCPYCSSKIIKKGLNDIFTKNPKLKECWDYKKNIQNGINPYEIGIKSHAKVWWICSNCKKEFKRSLSKIKDDVLCSKCSIDYGSVKRIQSLIKKNGSLIEVYPEIANEWNYSL